MPTLPMLCVAVHMFILWKDWVGASCDNDF